jgi:hypothetical protein
MKACWKIGVWVMVLLSTTRPLFLPASQEEPKPGPDDPILNSALETAASYCQKLQDFIYYFTCREEVVETIPSVVRTQLSPRIDGELLSPYALTEGSAPSITDSTQKNTYLYDYQLIRKKGIDQESRTLLEKNGQKKVEKYARLEAMKFYYRNMAFGPIDLFGNNGRLRHRYRIIDTVLADGQKVLVIEAAPKDDSLDYNPSGKVWLRQTDGAILRIEWDKRSLLGFGDVQAQAEEYGLVPLFTLVTEYDIEKNGIRFPSKVSFEEAYMRKKTKKTQVVSRVTIKYKDYKFFIVDVDVQFKECRNE